MHQERNCEVLHLELVTWDTTDLLYDREMTWVQWGHNKDVASAET